ncbi:MAG: fatty acid desaturase [Chloroflexi bacterium]|nr:fatty acid desaturase [Chloroflexota bacterium]
MTEYQPLAEVRQNLKVKWYRTKIDPQKMKELSQRSDVQGWFQAGGHVGLYLMTGAITFYFWSHQLWIPMLIALWFHGAVASFFVGVAAHELSHGSVFKTKRLNKIFLYLTSPLAWWDPFDYALSHTYHHRYTLHPEGDREVLLPLEPNLAEPFVFQLLTINLLTQRGRTFGNGGLLSTIYLTILGAVGRVGDLENPTNEWIQTLHDDQPEEYRKSIGWSRFLLVLHGGITVVSFLTGYWIFILLIPVAPFIANLFKYLVGLPQHCRLRENTPDFRKSVRSMKLNPILEFLYWRMNWHLEHHMYVGIPCYNLKKLNEEMAWDMPEPRTLIGAWKEMRETWRKQKVDPNYAFNTPLPPTATPEYTGEETLPVSTGEEHEDALSLGDLAPEGLSD